MTIVFIENVWGSGQIITVSEAFKDHVVSRRLEPGDNLRIAVSRFKSISIDEETSTPGSLNVAADGQGGKIPQAA